MIKTILSLIIFFSVVFNCHSQNKAITKSTILFTRESIATDFNYEKYKSDGIFWGHMPYRSIKFDWEMENWSEEVAHHTSKGKYFFGRGEFDWGWQWMIDYMEDPGSYWAMDLDSNYIGWTTEIHNGHYHNWQSHHGPDFLNWLKYQVDRMLFGEVTHIMFDSQTSATRTLHWLGGDFSVHAMAGFRKYLAEKYTTDELSEKQIENIDSFNYRNFLIDKGFTLNSYKKEALSIDGDIPLYKDFVYFHRKVLNDIMDELFEYIDTKMPGIDIGVTTNVIEPRGFVSSNRLTYLAGEFHHDYNTAQSPPFKPILHYKAAENLNKTLLYFPYPNAFSNLQKRNAPGQARAWIAQAYAMGSVFIVPGDVWTGSSGTWDPGWENHAYIYEFIHNNSNLLDDYKAVSNVALTYSVYASLLEAGMDGSKTALASLEYLINENISFDLQVFGDPDKPITPSASKLKQYDAIVTNDDIQYLTASQNLTLDSVIAQTVSITDTDKIKQLVSWKIDVSSHNKLSNELISALPRISTNSKSNYVVHLLNRKYNSREDKATTHHGITVKIPKAVFPNTIKGAKLHIPDKRSIDLSFQTDNADNVILDIGTFDTCWGIVELTHSESPVKVERTPLVEEILLYPNPANDIVRIKNKSDNLISSVEIFNTQGRLISKVKPNLNTINITTLNNGIYILKIKTENNIVVKKLIKE